MSTIYEIQAVATKMIATLKLSRHYTGLAYKKSEGDFPEAVKAACAAEAKHYRRKADALFAEAHGMARAMGVMASQLQDAE